MTASNALPPRLARLLPMLACPACHGDLAPTQYGLTCQSCARSYPIRSGKIYFVGGSAVSDPVDDFKEWVRRLIGPTYYTLAWIISPCLFLPYRGQVRAALAGLNGLVVDLGSGNLRLEADHVCVDFNPYAEVDLVCDITHLPFRAQSIAGFISSGVLEHVADGERAVAEIARCTAPGGRGFHLVPFLYPFHASPHDYLRWSAPGLERLFAECGDVRVENASGPVSTLLLALAEALAILGSFGRDRVKAVLYPILCALLCPLKFIDLIFVGRRSFMTVSPLLAVHTWRRERPDAGPGVTETAHVA